MNREKLLIIIHYLRHQGLPVTLDLLIEQAPLFFPGEHNMEAVQRAEYAALVGQLIEEQFLDDDRSNLRINHHRWMDFVRLRNEFSFKIGYGLARYSQTEKRLNAEEEAASILGLTDEEQRRYAASVITGFPEPVLDAGCGNGRVSEDIAEKAGVSLLGIDSADDAIAAARAVSEQEGPSSTGNEYYVYDMDRLATFDRTFNSTLAVDSFYFSNNMEGLVRELYSNNGKDNTLVFFSTYHPSEEPDSLMFSSRGSQLAEVLEKCGIRWTAEDFTLSDRRLWTRKLELIGGLKEGYYAENCAYLYWEALEEKEIVARMCSEKRSGRFAYRF
jgi:SAM-dependent methyltransferase